MKTCNTCGNTTNNFAAKNTTKCKLCVKEYNRQYGVRKKEAISKQKKQYRLDNLEKINTKDKLRYENKKDEILAKNKEYRNNNKESINKQRKEYRTENKELISERGKIFYQENKVHIKARTDKYVDENREMLNADNKQRSKDRRKNFLKEYEQEHGIPYETKYGTKNNVLYIWLSDMLWEDLPVWKIGITSIDSGEDRIKTVSRTHNVEVLEVYKFHMDKASVVETELKNKFNVIPKMKGCGYTEFRAVAYDEMMKELAVSFPLPKSLI